MMGYLIKYVDSVGVVKFTFFGDVMASFPTGNRDDIIRLMFMNVYPGCTVVEMCRCTFDEYQKFLGRYSK